MQLAAARMKSPCKFVPLNRAGCCILMFPFHTQAAFESPYVSLSRRGLASTQLDLGLLPACTGFLEKSLNSATNDKPLA